MIIIFMVYHESANFVFSCPAGAWWETGGGGHKIRHVGHVWTRTRAQSHAGHAPGNMLPLSDT